MPCIDYVDNNVGFFRGGGYVFVLVAYTSQMFSSIWKNCTAYMQSLLFTDNRYCKGIVNANIRFVTSLKISIDIRLNE